MATTQRLSIISSAKSTLVINDFSSRDTCSWSAVFSPPNLANCNFQLGIYPKINTFRNFEDQVFFALWISPPVGRVELPVQYRVSVLDANGGKHCTKDVFWNYTSSTKLGRDHSIIRLVPRAYLLDPVNGLLPGGKLTIYCEVDVLSRKIPQIPCEVTHQPTNKLVDTIRKDFKSLLENGQFSDVVLVVGKKELHAHKNILTARSKVFGAMFENQDTKESIENRIVIIDVDVDVFEQLLSYIYSGTVAKLNEYALELFVAADKYQLEHLKLICAQSLSSNLTVDTVANILVLSDMHSAPELKANCIKFITTNSTKVMATDGWKEMMKVIRLELMAELYEDIAKAHSALL